jgi:hypothetical protein
VDVAGDPALRATVQAAVRAGVPLSIFLGRPQITTYTHDPAGKVVRAETVLWTQDDRDAVYGLMAYEADLCPGCNQPLTETTSPENEERYVARPPLLCHRCVATESAAKKWENHAHPGALLIPIELEKT